MYNVLFYLKDWFRVEHPDADGDGYYSTSLPVIIFQMMEQNVSGIAMIYLCFRENCQLFYVLFLFQRKHNNIMRV